MVFEVMSLWLERPWPAPHAKRHYLGAHCYPSFLDHMMHPQTAEQKGAGLKRRHLRTGVFRPSRNYARAPDHAKVCYRIKGSTDGYSKHNYAACSSSAGWPSDSPTFWGVVRPVASRHRSMASRRAVGCGSCGRSCT